jgi:hypothetical protein
VCLDSSDLLRSKSRRVHRRIQRRRRVQRSGSERRKWGYSADSSTIATAAELAIGIKLHRLRDRRGGEPKGEGQIELEDAVIHQGVVKAVRVIHEAIIDNPLRQIAK